MFLARRCVTAARARARAVYSDKFLVQSMPLDPGVMEALASDDVNAGALLAEQVSAPQSPLCALPWCCLMRRVFGWLLQWSRQVLTHSHKIGCTFQLSTCTHVGCRLTLTTSVCDSRVVFSRLRNNNTAHPAGAPVVQPLPRSCWSLCTTTACLPAVCPRHEAIDLPTSTVLHCRVHPPLLGRAPAVPTPAH